jgi:hypothetical protein
MHPHEREFIIIYSDLKTRSVSPKNTGETVFEGEKESWLLMSLRSFYCIIFVYFLFRTSRDNVRHVFSSKNIFSYV